MGLLTASRPEFLNPRLRGVAERYLKDAPLPPRMKKSLLIGYYADINYTFTVADLSRVLTPEQLRLL